MDVAAKWGAVCNTYLVCAKLRLLRAQCRRRSSGGGQRVRSIMWKSSLSAEAKMKKESV